MIRFVILAVVAYIFYRALKSWMFPKPDASRSVPDRKAGEIDDIMIKDPFCEAYFPKRNAVRHHKNGKDLYFCSTRCRDQYVQARSDEKAK
jgi:YHS domain-containing protein